MKNYHFLFLVVLIAFFSSCKKDIDSTAKLSPEAANDNSQKKPTATARAADDYAIDYKEGYQSDDDLIWRGGDNFTALFIELTIKFPTLDAKGFPDRFYVHFSILPDGSGTVFTNNMFGGSSPGSWHYTPTPGGEIHNNYFSCGGTLTYTSDSGTTEYWVTTNMRYWSFDKYESNILIRKAD
jgi:hypothetical protein